MVTRELRSRLRCDGDAGERQQRESDEETELRQCDGARERLRLESVRI